jgi:TonB family protein
VLSRARAAFAAGRYESPAGRNALDLYAAVLLARPDQAEARGGLDRTIDQVVSIARLAEAGGNHAEARRLLARVESADASNVAVARLAAYLAAPAPQDSAAAPGAAATSRPQAAPTAARPADTHAPATATVPPPATTSPHAGIASAPQAATRARTGAAAHPATATDRPALATASPVVRPDPLAPRVINADQMHEKELLESRRHRPRTYGPPVSSGLPIAGYVKTRPPEPSAYKSASGIDPAVAAALAMPADELNRVYATDPVYPTAAFRDHVEGWVELSFTITETGTVRDIEVVDAEPRGVFESAASEALGAWRFKPRLANGQPVSRRSTVTLRFNVDG